MTVGSIRNNTGKAENVSILRPLSNNNLHINGNILRTAIFLFAKNSLLK
jgi:hypothetical protein